MTAVNLSKQQALDADRKAIQQINFTANLNKVGNARIHFVLKDTKNCFGLFTRNCKIFVKTISLNAIS